MPKLPPSRRPRVKRRYTTPADKAARAAEHERHVFELRSKGYSFPEIAKIVGITRQGCEQAYYRTLAQLSRHDADEHRALSLERLGRMRRKLWDRHIEPESGVQPGQECPTCHQVVGGADLQAFNVSVRIEERESKLLGLDAPSQMNVMMGAPAKIAVDVKSRTEAIERLSIDEQRQLLHLIRKMRGEPPYPLPPLAPPPVN